VPSSSRLSAFGKYLNALSNAINSGDYIREPGLADERAQLHILYLLSDILHWQKYHRSDTGTYKALAQDSGPWIHNLFAASLGNNEQPSRKYESRILRLLQLWAEESYFSTSVLQQLREATQGESSAKQDTSRYSVHSNGRVPPPEGKDAPWIIPEMHGDPSTPYYDLPAANMIPLITPNSSRPIDSRRMKALKLYAGPADKKLMSLVQDLIREVDRIYDGPAGQDDNYAVPDVDLMGQPIILDELGERVESDTYYGWSRAFCENMHKKMHGNGQNPSRSRSDSGNSRDRSRSHSRSPRKRQRSLSSDSRSRSRSHVRRRPAYSSSRSPSRSRYRHRSTSPRPARSRSPDTRNLPKQPAYQAPPPQQAIPPLPVPLGHDGMPIPPPRPPGWTGPWPPPPPPLPFEGQYAPLSVAPGFVPPPPPNLGVGMQGAYVPPPPPQGHGQWSGRGGRGGRGRGW
jgi:CID domain